MEQMRVEIKVLAHRQFGIEDRRLARVVSEDGLPLPGWQEIPPGRIYDAGRHAVYPQRMEFRCENGDERGYSGIRRADAGGSWHGGLPRHHRNESDAAILAQKGKSRLSHGEMRIDLFLRALAHVSETDRRRGTGSLEREDRIVGHGGCGLVRSRGQDGFDTQSLSNISALCDARRRFPAMP